MSRIMIQSPSSLEDTSREFTLDGIPILPTLQQSVVEPRTQTHCTRLLKDFSASNLKRILEASSLGEAIFNVFKSTGTLESKCQSYITEIIIQHFLNEKPFCRMVNADFAQISQNIVKIFPCEIKELYYTPPNKQRNEKNAISRGKLPDKYRNTLTFLRKAGLFKEQGIDINNISTSSIQPASIDMAADGEEDAEEAIIWLKNKSEPWTAVLEKWQKSFKKRIALFRKDDNIISQFPALRNSNGYVLIDQDFKRLFPNCTDFYESFEKVFRNLLNVKKKNLDSKTLLLLDIINAPKTSIDTRHYFMIQLFCELLPHRRRIPTKKGKRDWIPTSADSVGGLIEHVKNAADIQNAITTRTGKLHKIGFTLKPFVIAIGLSSTELRQFYVSYNGNIYEVPTFLKGIETCFQIMHVFNIKYSPECEHLWLFFQLAMFHIKTQYDDIPTILDLANKCQ